MAHENAHQLYGSTSKSSCVPSASRSSWSFESSSANDSLNLSSATKPRGISNRKLLRGVRGQYLADALMVWDCYARAPRIDYPLLLRFENCDYVASAQNHELAIESQAGDICAVSPDQLPFVCIDKRGAAKPSSQDDCLVWLPARQFSPAIGQQVINVYMDAQGATIIVLEDCYIRLKSHGPQVDVFLSRF